MRRNDRFRKATKSEDSILIVCLFCMVSFILIAAPQAMADDDQVCIPVQARIEAFFVADGCTSPVGLCTAGQITQGGLLNGQTYFTALDVAPGAGLPNGYEPDTTLSYTGILVVTTKRGILSFSDVGVFDQEKGLFSEIDRIDEGTGTFAEASGELFIYGESIVEGTGFIGFIKGEVCIVR